MPAASMANGSDRFAARFCGARPLRSSDAAIAKPFLPCHSTSHHSLQLVASTRLPPGILATVSLVVHGRLAGCASCLFWRARTACAGELRTTLVRSVENFESRENEGGPPGGTSTGRHDGEPELFCTLA